MTFPDLQTVISWGLSMPREVQELPNIFLAQTDWRTVIRTGIPQNLVEEQEEATMKIRRVFPVPTD